MRFFIMSALLATATMLGSAAMAQEGGITPRYNQPPAVSHLATRGPATAYAPHWSRNSGVFNTMTSDPSFVEHDHGHP